MSNKKLLREQGLVRVDKETGRKTEKTIPSFRIFNFFKGEAKFDLGKVVFS